MRLSSNNHPEHSVELSADNSMTSHCTEESWMMPDVIEYGDSSSFLIAAAAASIAFTPFDGTR